MSVRAAGGGALVAAVVLALGAGSARADFTETTCAGGPATQWETPMGPRPAFAGEIDRCGTGGDLQFTVAGDLMTPGSTASAGLTMPPGEVLTGISVIYATRAATGSAATVYFGADNVELGSSVTGQSDVTYSGPLSDASTFVFTVYCTGSGGASTDCEFPGGYDALDIGPTALTIHDTGSPAVAAAGGSLATPGRYAGVQTIGYTAQDGGSGVAKVTATLGTAVVATASPACQSFELSPCPHTASGTLAVDTTALKNGSYPLTLTAYDMSGDPMSVTVDTVRIANTGTVSVAPKRRRRGHIDTRVITGWNFGHRPFTRVTSLRFARLPRHARVALRCTGRGCPRRRWSPGRRVRRFERRLRGTRFRAGDRLTFTIRARRRRTERIRITIRDGRRPTGRVLP